MKQVLIIFFVLGAIGQALAASRPYALESVDSYWDGGTVSFVVTDSTGIQIKGCFATTAGFSEISGKLYLGAMHMDDKGARLATAAEDSVVLAVLIHALGLAYPQMHWEDKSFLCSSSNYESLTDSKGRLFYRALSAHAGCGWQREKGKPR